MAYSMNKTNIAALLYHIFSKFTLDTKKSLHFFTTNIKLFPFLYLSTGLYKEFVKAFFHSWQGL